MCVPFARSFQILRIGSGDDTWVQPQHRKQVKRVRFVSRQVHGELSHARAQALVPRGGELDGEDAEGRHSISTSRGVRLRGRLRIMMSMGVDGVHVISYVYCKRCGCERGAGGGVRRAATAQVMAGGVVRGGRSANLHGRDEKGSPWRGATREKRPLSGVKRYLMPRSGSPSETHAA